MYFEGRRNRNGMWVVNDFSIGKRVDGSRAREA